MARIWQQMKKIEHRATAAAEAAISLIWDRFFIRLCVCNHFFIHISAGDGGSQPDLDSEWPSINPTVAIF